jgi:uncharacterized protein
VARYHVSRDYIRHRIIDGSLPAVRSGRRIIRVNSADLEPLFRPVQSMRSLQPSWEQLHSTCYIWFVSTSLAEVARRADGAVTQARAELVRAVRQAAASGMSQTQIAAEIGRSQPEVSRLLHFHGTTPLARRLRQHSSEVRQLITTAGGSNVRVFGSVATGHDHEGSDIDLLFTMGTPLSLMQLGALEQQLSDVLDTKVDLVPDSVLRPEFRDRALAEAVSL